MDAIPILLLFCFLEFVVGGIDKASFNGTSTGIVIPLWAETLLGIGFIIMTMIGIFIFLYCTKKKHDVPRAARVRIDEFSYDSSNPLQFDQDSCTLCLYEFEDGHLLSTLSCGHTFYAECISQYISPAATPMCPYCRQAIVVEDHV